MTPGDRTGQAEPPTPVDVLRWCAALGSEPWFPALHAARHDLDRDSLHEPVWLLHKAGLLQVADWVKGQGQGFRVTPAGERVLAEPQATPAEPAAPPIVAPEPEAVPPRPAVLAPLLMLACLAWFLVGTALAWRGGVSAAIYLNGGSVPTLIEEGAVRGPELLGGGWWRLLASSLVHVGLVQLVVNVMSLGMIGPVAEDLWGRARFAAHYLTAALCSAAAAVAVHPEATTAGASGAIWGLLMAVLAWLLRHRAELEPEVAASCLRKLAFLMVLNALISLLPGVGWEGHLAGGMAGFVAAWLLDWRQVRVRKRRVAAGLVGLAGLLAGTLSGLAAATYSAPDWLALRETARAGPRPPDPRAELAGHLTRVAPDRLAEAQARLNRVASGGLGQDSAPAREAERLLQQLLQDLIAAQRIVETPARPDANARLAAYLRAAFTFALKLQRHLPPGPPPTAVDWREIEALREGAARLWQ